MKYEGRRPAIASSRVVSPEKLVEFIEAKFPATRVSGRVLALLMLDLRRADRLRALAGDRRSREWLTKIVARVEKLLRPEDRLAQVSEDEVWIALPNLPHPQIAAIAVSRILDALDRTATAPGATIHPCIGVACFPEHGDSVEALLGAADLARRSATRREDRYWMHQPAQSAPARDPRFTSELKAALKSNELELHYQPQVELRSRRCHSAEALIRWRQRDGRQISPALIAEAAEDGEILHSFMQFVLNTALRHMTVFERERCPVRVGVNVSAMLVSDAEMPAIVEQLIHTWGISPAHLTIEVTERAIVSDAEQCAKVLRNLKQLGVRLAMDDFGTGYSSLAHLKLFPFDELKIDQLFIRNMLHSPGDTQIVRAMIDLGHSFNMEVVAEGVEDGPTLERLRNLNCDVAQGYAIAEPMSVDRFRAWWRARENPPPG